MKDRFSSLAAVLFSFHLAPGLWLGVAISLVGCLFAVLPVTAELETDIGLAALFRLRGARPAPSEAVIVSIDNESARKLEVRGGINQWPRNLHAQLVKTLKREGARVIAFDVFFKLPRDANSDQDFARALSHAGNVVLFAQLNQHAVQIPNERGDTKTVLIEELVPPIDSFSRAGLAYAPFPLPKIPARVNQAWLFKTSSGEVPTLPVMAFHQFVRPALLDLKQELDEKMEIRIADSDPNRFGALVGQMRRSLREHPELLPESRPSEFYLALRDFYRLPNSVYINFYGPAQTIRTVPYFQALREFQGQGSSFQRVDFQDKAVFVGNSEKFQPDLKDDFHTVFSQEAGFDLSGVEIMATVFANLLARDYLRPIEHGLEFTLVTIWGLLIGLSFCVLPGFRWIAGAAAVLAIGYLLLAVSAFKQQLWIPVVNPLLFQLPLGIAGSLLLKYRATHQRSRRMQQAAAYFLPNEVVLSLAEWKREELGEAGRVVEGVCLASDAESFASFAENIEPSELKSRLNQYYELLFQPIRERDGKILDVAGDAMLAFWENHPDRSHARLKACEAALEIHLKTVVGNSNLNSLPTRIGLHAGKMVIGNVGAGDHFEFRAVGDVINTASRIEGLNKHLGTRVLASSAVAGELEDFVTRRVGKFRLKGKEHHIEIFELLRHADHCDQRTFDKREIFLQGLEQYEAGYWREAKMVFDTLLREYGGDGPSEFYQRVCAEYIRNEPSFEWDGVYTLKVK